jgi:peptidoglycan/xylan/chitin deacetylase (PgdA/CDA1 family)
LWQIETKEKKVYLTFDDGPTPDVTPFVLDVLKRFRLKATFFCIGDNVAKHPTLYQSVIDQGHAVGNHTFDHLNGFKTTLDTYVQNTTKASELIDSKLFRPPYGRIRKSQIGALGLDYSIVMWSIISGDFDETLNKERAMNKMMKGTEPGSIIVFHDSLKSLPNLEVLLPKYCEFLAKNNYTSCGL